MGLASFSLAGLYSNHADLSPRYAPVLLGLTNTSGALPGIVGIAVSGALCMMCCAAARCAEHVVRWSATPRHDTLLGSLPLYLCTQLTPPPAPPPCTALVPPPLPSPPSPPGALYDYTGSWALSLFAPSIFFFLTGAAAYVAHGSADRQDFDNPALNLPFALEGALGFGGAAAPEAQEEGQEGRGGPKQD